LELATLRTQVATQAKELESLRRTQLAPQCPQPRLRTVDVNDDENHVDVVPEPADISPEIEASPGSQVPQMVELVLTDEARANLHHEIEHLHSAVNSLQGVTGLEDIKCQLKQRLQELRSQLRRAKPLADRKAALVAGLQRKNAACSAATTAREGAEAALAQARVVERQSLDARDEMAKELDALEHLIQAELVAESPDVQRPADLEILGMLHQALAAFAAGQAPPLEWCSAASALVASAQSATRTPVRPPAPSPLEGHAGQIAPAGTTASPPQPPLVGYAGLPPSVRVPNDKPQEGHEVYQAQLGAQQARPSPY